MENETFSLEDSKNENESKDQLMRFFKLIIIDNSKTKRVGSKSINYINEICQFLITNLYEYIFSFDKNFVILFEVKDQLINSRINFEKNSMLFEFLALYDLKIYHKYKRIRGFALFGKLKEVLEEKGLRDQPKSQKSSDYYYVFADTLKKILSSRDNDYCESILHLYYKELFESFIYKMNVVIPEKFLSKEFEYKLLKFFKTFLEILFVDEIIADYNDLADLVPSHRKRTYFHLIKDRTDLILQTLREWIIEGNTLDIKSPSNFAISIISFIEKESRYSIVKRIRKKSKRNISIRIHRSITKNRVILKKIIDEVVFDDYDKYNELIKTINISNKKIYDEKNKLVRILEKVGDKNINESNRKRLEIEENITKYELEIRKLKDEKRLIRKSLDNLSKKDIPQKIRLLLVEELVRTRDQKEIITL